MGNNTQEIITAQSVFRIGTVYSVDGREVKIKVDKKKNSSHLFFKGELIKNISVGGYIKIIKGFTPIIGKVESESIYQESLSEKSIYSSKENDIDRILIVQLLGYLETKKYNRGIKELPLIDNECYLLSNEEFELIHNFVTDIDDLPLRIGTLSSDSFIPISLGVKSLFTSHIGIFGNTGSGKSYTLAKLYRQLFEAYKDYPKFKLNSKFLFFDFNGEYSGKNTIVSGKKIYTLSTRKEIDKIPMSNDDLLNIDLLSIFANATEKTQRPFISRCIKLAKSIKDDVDHFKNILKKNVIEVLCMSDKQKANLILDYFEQILPPKYDENGLEISLRDGISYNDSQNVFYLGKWGAPYQKFPDTSQERNRDYQYAKSTTLYKQVDSFEYSNNFIEDFIKIMYLRLIRDVLDNRAINEHIAPAIGKLKAIEDDIQKIFSFNGNPNFWSNNNIVIINLNDVNTEFKKLIPMLLANKLYKEHKMDHGHKLSYLNIIIDEAHNILSYQSNRESETWKDYRLEVFEEIIKEGRKYGVFMTIASQRPSDISSTIVSQLHNYFIHRLVNEHDINMVNTAISYLDKVSIESLPILSTGVCVIAGQLAEMPIVVQIDKIENEFKPHNETIDISSLWTNLESN